MSAIVMENIIARLKAQVTALHGRVEDAGELARLIAAGTAPRQVPAGFVVPIGEDAEPAVDMSGTLRQRVTETIGIVLVNSVAGDASGAKSRAPLDLINDAVKTALVGWEPAPGCDLIEFRRSRLVGLQAGAVFIQTDVLTRWYLRA
ncbi:hypothetical protein [Dongia sp.]|uniref:phage tail terminator protein n=1 Tax=Dongia sp. TaxID=1977262 RepID=UPI0035AE6EF9